MRTRSLSLVLTGILALAATPSLGQVRSSTLGPPGLAEQSSASDEAALDAARRQELIADVLRAREKAAGRTLSPALRGYLAGRMLEVPTGALEEFLEGGGLGDVGTLALAAPGPEPRAIGDSASDLVYTPVEPCRIVDTRFGGGAIAAGSARSFLVTGAAGFGAQGGNASGCGIPDDATAAVLNFVAVNPQGAGHLQAYPYNAVPVVPTASVINYSAVGGLNIANGVVQPICNSAMTTCTYDLIVRANVSTAELVVDVLGYFRRFDKAQVKSFSVFRSASGGPTASTCSNYGGVYVTITAPVAGSVVANAAMQVMMTHVNGGSGTELDFFWETSASACLNNTTFAYLPTSSPTATYYQPVGATRRFTVAAGSTTVFYLNSKAFVDVGEGITLMGYSSMTATFTPD
ncbi:MAG: hypothetical protein IPP07_09185 [Holophagales bacterium]|nr:hypothetical protein [Holophagales bacterium]MBK9965043.1 hypothetical protein [Holophagales bacterium]